MWYIQGANVIMIFSMVAHFPLTAFGLRRTIESMIWKDQDAPTKWRLIICAVVIAIAGFIGSVVTQISDILTFTSAIAGSCVIYIFPAIFGFRYLYFVKKTAFWKCLACMCCGIFVAVVGVSCALFNKIKK